MEKDRLPPDVAYIRTMIANAVLLGEPGQPDWVLVDAGVPAYASQIARFAELAADFDRIAVPAGRLI